MVSLHRSWRIANLDEIDSYLSANSILMTSSSCVLDGSALEQIDTAGAMLALRALERAGVSRNSIKLVNFSERNRNVIELAGSSIEEPEAIRARPRFGFVATTGEEFLAFCQTVSSTLNFIGATSIEFLRAMFAPMSLRIKELCVQLEIVGLNAIPIICLVNFLIGVVIAYLTGVQIEKFGANIFIVDGIAIATCRELSPILVAIVIAGRSGSAFTAQIGTMKINEEVDAMTTLGLSPMRVIVLPRILALMISMPILVFIGDIAGIFGGMLIGDLRLGVTGATFLERLRVVLPIKHVLVGIAKAPVFAFFIAIIACRLGLAVENNARSVGINTTRTVVRSIVAVILLNAAFAVVLSELGI